MGNLEHTLPGLYAEAHSGTAAAAVKGNQAGAVVAGGTEGTAAQLVEEL